MLRIINHEDHHNAMHFLFNQVCDPADWKAPIECIVPWSMANVYMQAIEFMTAVKPDFTRKGEQAHLSCVGYRAGPAGP